MGEFLKDFGNDQKELILILHRTQEEHGYIPPSTIKVISKHLKISESEIYGVLTFYKAFSLKPRGKHLITICLGTACHVRGAPTILDEFKRKLSLQPGQTTSDNVYSLETVNCVGTCALGPIVIADGEYHGQMKTREVDKLIRELENREKDRPE